MSETTRNAQNAGASAADPPVESEARDASTRSGGASGQAKEGSGRAVER